MYHAYLKLWLLIFFFWRVSANGMGVGVGREEVEGEP